MTAVEDDHRKPSEVVLNDLRKLGTDEKRRQYLTGLFAPKTRDKAELRRRAHLCTDIRIAGLWPK